MDTDRHALLNEVASYYDEKLARHGNTPQGVDWNGEQSQLLRFKQLCRVFDEDQRPFSVNDLGCGYGALFDYLRPRHPGCSYLGVDIAAGMVAAAQARHAAHGQARFQQADAPDRIADYGIASGVLNVRQGRSDEEWFAHLQGVLDTLDRSSRLGFAFNCLTSYSDPQRKRAYLYYADPCQIFALCKQRHSSQVALLHDYGLFEFTVLVRKSA